MIATSLIVGGEEKTRMGHRPHPKEYIVSLEERGSQRIRKLAARAVGPGCGSIALDRCGHIFEHLFRQVLLEQRFALDPRRALYYHAPDASGKVVAQSREIDAICLSDAGDPHLVVEVRTSVQGMRGYCAKKFQLEKTLGLMRPLWPDVCGLVVFISVGPEPVETTPRGIIDGLSLDRVALERAYRWTGGAAWHPEFPVAVIPFTELVRWARGRGWWFHPTLLREARTFAEERWTRRTVRRAMHERFIH